MNVSSEKPLMIFVNEYNGKKFYKTSLFKKNKEGKHEYGNIDIQFKKEVEFKNKEQIYIKDAFITFYKSKDEHTIPYIFVMDFERLEDTIERSKETDIVKQDTKDEYKDLGSSVKLEDLDIDPDLPF